MGSRYILVSDLNTLVMPAQALPAWITSTIQQTHCDAASDLADSYLNDRLQLPIVGTPPPSLQMKCAQIAAYTLITLRGYNPDNKKDATIKAGYDDAMAWLEGISEGKILPPNIADSTPGGGSSIAPFVLQASTDQTTQSSIPGKQTLTGNGSVTIGPPSLRGWK